jgi:hypothetical protein
VSLQDARNKFLVSGTNTAVFSSSPYGGVQQHFLVRYLPPAGNTGPAGIDGITGVAGRTGSTGPTGPRGATATEPIL